MRSLTLCTLLAAGVASFGAAQERPGNGFGVGVMVGEPTGLSLKKWIRDDRALDAGIAWSFSGSDSLHLHADYLVHRFDLLSGPAAKGRMPLYFGLGARVKLHGDDNGKGRDDGDARVGVRAPLGITYLFDDAPFDLFVEVVPVLDLVPDTDVDLNAAIGARFYF